MARTAATVTMRQTVARAALAVAVIGAATGDAHAADGPRPNIVVMLVDNLGYGDIGVYGGGAVRGAPTPRIDALASQGLRLTNFNVEPECTPTRSALMTGRMPIRSGTASVDISGGKDGLTPWEYTLAELLSDAGYATAAFGKWHLGSAQGRHPIDQGFDEWYGIPRSSSDTLWALQNGYDASVAPTQSILEGRKGTPSREVKDYDYAARAMIDIEITDRAVAYVEKNAKGSKPFFLYVPFTLPHSPPLAAPQFVKPGRSQYQNALAEIDANVGRVLDALDKAGVDGNTIVVFTSDNGPETIYGRGVDFGGQADSGPFRGEFPSAWEGAIRVPGIIRWPAHTKPDRVSNEVVSVLDFYRTFASVAGAAHRVPTDRAIDSIDQTKFMFGDQEKSNRESVMFFYGSDLLCVKWRNFKIHFQMRDPASGAVVVPGQGVINAVKTTPGGYPWVFDVENDPKELWNISASSGWLAKIMATISAAYAKSIADFPNLAPGAEGPP